MLTEKQLSQLIKKTVNERISMSEEDVADAQPTAGTSSQQSGGQGYPEVGKWESGIERGAGNQIGVTKWSDVVGSKLVRGKSNPLKEQSDYMMDKRGNALAYSVGVRDKKDYEMVDKMLDKSRNLTLAPVDPHTRNTILSIAALLIPYVGVYVSAGIMAYDAKQYYDEGDTKSAGLMLMFATLPVAGKVLSKIPSIAKLGTKGMSSLASKIRIGSKALNPTEIEVLNGIAKNRQLIQSEMKNATKEITLKAAKANVKKQIVKKNVTKGAINTGKDLAGYTAAGVAYDKTYDAVERNIEQKNLDKLNAKLGITSTDSTNIKK